MAEEIPQDVQLLLRDRVTSLEALTVLLLLRGTAPRRWSIAALTAETHTAPEPMLAAVELLRGASLIERELQRAEPRYYYVPSDAASGRAVDRLAREFEERRVAVISLLNSFALERVRNGAARAFADAFILKRSRPDKEDEDG
jgi:hypothetical protein